MTEKVATLSVPKNELPALTSLSQGLLLRESKNKIGQILDPLIAFCSEKPDKHFLYQNL